MPVLIIHRAKTHLSRLVEDVPAGKEIMAGKAGRPIARAVALVTALPRRVLGGLVGRLHVPDDVDAPLPEHVLASFETI